MKLNSCQVTYKLVNDFEVLFSFDYISKHYLYTILSV